MSEHKSLAEALAAFQAELPKLGKDSTANAGTYSYEYADLAAVSQAVLPVMAKHGLSFSSKPTVVDGKFVLEYVLRHANGDEDRGLYPLPSGRPQEVGSAITYARRYVLLAMSGVFPGGEDDDGKAAQETRVEVGPHWDPMDQAAERDGWEQEIGKAKTLAELNTVGARVFAAKNSGRLSPNTYEYLSKAGATRRADIEKQAKEASNEPVTEDPADPAPGSVGEPAARGGSEPARPTRSRG